MENLENWVKEELFDIKKQKLEALDNNTTEKLQKSCKVYINKWYWTEWFLWTIGVKSLDYNTADINKSKLPLYFPECAKQLEEDIDSHWNANYITSKDKINAKAVPLFKIIKAYQKDWKYFFYTGEWYLLSADKADFDHNWLRASSMKFYWNQCPDSDIFGNTNKTIIANGIRFENKNDWFIHWYTWTWYKNHFMQLPWDEVFKIEPASELISEGGRLHQYKISTTGYKKWEVYDVPYKGIKQMFVDYNKNFLFIVNETENWSKLHIINMYDFINKNEITEIYQINDVSEVVWFEKDWWLFCKSSNWNIDYYWTTIANFRNNFFSNEGNRAPWKLIYPKEAEITEVKDGGKNSLLQQLENWEISISLDDDIEDESNKIDDSIVEKIWQLEFNINWSKSTLKELFESATDEKSITVVYHIFEKIKKNPDIVKYEWVLKWMEKKIVEKKNKILISEIFSELDSLIAELWVASDLPTLITIQDKCKEIKKRRKNIQAWIVKQDKELDELLQVVSEKIKDYQDTHKDEMVELIEDNLDKIDEILKDIKNAIDISSIYDNPIYDETKNYIINLSKENREVYNKKLKDLINARRDEIRTESDKAKKEAQNLIDSLKKDVEEDIKQIEETIDDIDSIEAVEQIKENDPLVLKIKEKLAELPSSDAQKLDLTLDRIFSERIFKLRLWWEESKWIIQNLDSYWVDTILYYNEDWTEKIDWKIEGKKNPDWSIWLVIKLMNWETHEYNEDTYLKDAEKFDEVLIWDDTPYFNLTIQEFTKFSKKLAKYKRSWKEELKELAVKLQNETDPVKKEKLKNEYMEMRKYYKDARYTEALVYKLVKQQKLNPRSKVPPFDPYYIVLDEEKEILKKLSGRLVDQKQNSGIEILEWWPGLWKTVMCEFLANVTNREIVRVQCSKMDPSDMFFSPTLKKWETSREPADWIKLMQKPWTIILFDEIDKLNDQCFERLHSLFDRSRSVYDPQLWSVKANQDCLFLWTRNSYDRLSNPILSRWRILQINYPWLLNEAFKVSKYTTSSVLRKMTYEEFKMLYEKYITRWEPAPTNAQEKSIYELVQNINHLLNVFNKLREQYWADEPFAFELSYRDARQIFVDYNSWWSFKEALEWVLIPKARWAVIDPDEKYSQETMVEAAIIEEMGL